MNRLLLALPLLCACSESAPDVSVDASTSDAQADTGPEDLGEPDTGSIDTGVVDTGVLDTGVVDTGVVDTGVADTGLVDMGAAPTWEGDIAPLVTTYCVPCHDTGNARRDYNLYADAFRDRDNIRCGVAPSRPAGCNGFPPPNQFPVGNGPMPTQIERLLMVEWVESGAAER